MQSWFTVLGLVLDISGILLIAIEWWIANYSPPEVLDAYRRGYADGWLEEGSELPVEELKRRAGSDEHISRGIRKDVVFYGVGLAVLGFVFQLIGAWPA
jgi:hypothetical protein